MSKKQNRAQSTTVATENKALASHIESVDGPKGEAQSTQPPRSMADINAALDGLDETTRAQLKAMQVPAHQLHGTTGKYRTKDGKAVTDNRAEAKLSVNGKPIPVFNAARPAVTVNGVSVSATHADETLQLRGRYSQGWGQQVIEACRKRAEGLKRNLTQRERDDVLRKLGDTVPKAWQPRYNKDESPASQYARHIAVQDEFKCGSLN